MVTLQDRPFTAAEAGLVTAWTYPPPHDVYDLGAGHGALLLERSPSGHGYHPAVDGSGELVAFAVFGVEARVRGQVELDGTLDVGLGVRPDATSRGLGTELLEQALDLGRERWSPARFRVAVATFNTRSLALCARAGFTVDRELDGPGGRPFHELTRAAAPSPAPG